MIRQTFLKNIRVEFFYDSTIEPYSFPKFELDSVKQLINILATKGVEIKIIDTAGWTREMLSEYFYKALQSGKKLGNIFGVGRKKGWHFGREVPVILIIKNDSLIDIYPRLEKNKIIPIEEGLRGLLKRLEVDK